MDMSAIPNVVSGDARGLGADGFDASCVPSASDLVVADLLERRKVEEVLDRRRSVSARSRCPWSLKFDFVVKMRNGIRVAVLVPPHSIAEPHLGCDRLSRSVQRLRQTSITHLAVLSSATSARIDYATVIPISPRIYRP